MTQLIELNCTYCNVSFAREYRSYKYEIKKSNGNYHPFCSTTCINLYKCKKVNVCCDFCNKEFKQSRADSLKEYKHTFCSHSCNAKFYNKLRKLEGYTTKGKKKNAVCLLCQASIEVSVHAELTTYYCRRCWLPKKKIRIEGKHICITCSGNVPGNGKYCSICRSLIFQKTACANAAKRKDIKRSKNEILLGNFCAEKYKNITYNQPMFNGWDSDIQLHDYKIAVHWNGAWHYKYCGGKHSIDQVQSRDKIKHENIEKCGWINYIIKDMGKFNEPLVRSEFEKLQIFINENFK